MSCTFVLMAAPDRPEYPYVACREHGLARWNDTEVCIGQAQRLYPDQWEQERQARVLSRMKHEHDDHVTRLRGDIRRVTSRIEKLMSMHDFGTDEQRVVVADMSALAGALEILYEEM